MCPFWFLFKLKQINDGSSSLTHGHHVVPAVHEAQVEALPVRRVGGDEHGDVPVSVLQDAHGPRTQEPADRQQHHAQDPQQVQAGQVGHPLRRAREEHLQHPVGKKSNMFNTSKGVATSRKIL